MAKKEQTGGINTLLEQLKGADLSEMVEKVKSFTETEEGKAVLGQLLSELGKEKPHGRS